MQNQNDWYAPLREIASLGSTSKRPGSLAGLAQARRENLAQFFTPDALVQFMWKLIAPAVSVAEQGGMVSIFDNSLGSGRMFQFCDPAKHVLAGVDVHADSLDEVRQVAEAAGFECEFEHCGMEGIQPNGFSVAMINPPFSIHLESPTLANLPCTTWGKFGPNTSALSQYYALAQALEAAEIVVAVMPKPSALEMVVRGEEYLGKSHHRLAACIHLPAGAFREEGTEVSTSLLVYDLSDRKRVAQFSVDSLDEALPDLELTCRPRSGFLNVVGVDEEKPSITLPVTGNPRVVVKRDGRYLKLQFTCGLMQSKVMNDLLNCNVRAFNNPRDPHRYPKNVKYEGQGKLDLELHLMQDDPMASLSLVMNRIAAEGGQPEFAPGVLEFFQRRIREVAREKTPMRHTVWVQSKVKDAFVGVALDTHVLDPKRWLSPVIKAGQKVEFRRVADKWEFSIGTETQQLTLDEVAKKYEIPAVEPGWQTVHEGLNVRFPEQAQWWRKRVYAMGIDKWLSWDFQIDDLVEFMLCPKGAVCAWEMGLGKTRLAYAMILLSGVKHGLIATEAYLVPEIVRILKEQLPISEDSWQVIETPEQARNLRQINVISVTRLRANLNADTKQTYAHVLRNRVGLMMVDEGELLANPDSQQSVAIHRVSAKRLFVLTGTPIPNYPRDTLPIIAAVSGNGTAAQPFGTRGAFMRPENLTSMAFVPRGVDAFRDNFVTLEWVTNEFAENMTQGAKREVPKIGNLSSYRAWMAPHIKRRLMKEPEVARFVTVKDPVIHTPVQLKWERGHLAYYLTVADEFAAWFKKSRGVEEKRSGNLVALLARINAVIEACNYPQQGKMGLSGVPGLTSKQRWCVERLVELSQQGHKTIFYCHKPAVVELIRRELAIRGVEGVPFHGGIPIKQRTNLLNTGFRNGAAPVLLATKGCTQAGLNIPQADYILFYDRAWAAKEERQAMRRAVRPEQTKQVHVEYAHIKGSIDDYMGQMCEFKADCADAGLDWATPEKEGIEFLHLDQILEQFVSDLAELHGVRSYQIRDVLKEAA